LYNANISIFESTLIMSIQVSHISKIYGEQKALDNISFSINKGEIVGLLGPNGAGKSTLMKILTTYISPTNGDAVVNNYSVLNNKKEVQKSIGYLPEHNPLYLDMYVREYLQYSAKIYHCDKTAVEQAIEQTGLTPEAHKKIGQLSKGYRQRVGIANAILHNPDVLVLDEPTTGLDPNQLIDIRNLISEIGKEKTVILSTHIMQEVEAICDRVILLNKGNILLDKNMDELTQDDDQCLEVEFDYRVEVQLLEKLPHLSKAINTYGFVYEIHFNTKEDMRSVVFDFAKDSGLKILQMNPKNSSLEKLFTELTLQK